MKNFLEATAIKPTLEYPIELLLTPLNQCVCVALINNEVVHDGLLSGPKVVTVKNRVIDSPVEVKIIMTRQHPEALDVKVRIDGHEIIPLYADTIANPPTNYLNFNGEWTMNILSFYPWLHDITGQGWIA
jgi:hypothetical protein